MRRCTKNVAEHTIYVGAVIRIQNLKIDKNFNGCEGIVDHWKTGGNKCKWVVKVGANGLIAIRAENIHIIRSHPTKELMRHVTGCSVNLAKLPWIVPCKEGWGGSCPTLESICERALASVHPLLHGLTHLQISTVEIPHLWHLPYDALVRMTFTRAALSAGVQCRNKDLSYSEVHLTLKAHNVATIEGLGVALRLWTEQNDSVRDVWCGKLTSQVLAQIGRPGAWLLDCIHTEQLALLDPASYRNVTYTVLSNTELMTLFVAVLPHCPSQDDWPQRNKNYRGNQLEYLAWLALEDDKPELILALAWHARQIWWL